MENEGEICVPFVNVKHHTHFMTYDLLVIFEDYNNKAISPIEKYYVFLSRSRAKHKKKSLEWGRREKYIIIIKWLKKRSEILERFCNKLADNALSECLHEKQALNYR